MREREEWGLVRFDRTGLGRLDLWGLTGRDLVAFLEKPGA